MKYRVRQEVVEARQIVGDPATIVTLMAWCNGKAVDSVVEGMLFHVPTGKKVISMASVGDWIVKDGDDFIVMIDAEFKRKYAVVQEPKAVEAPKAAPTKTEATK